MGKAPERLAWSTETRRMGTHLSNEFLDVTITPERGADITRLVDKKTGIQLFAEAPTGIVSPNSVGWSDSLTQWISGYPGGWQILVPNAGEERVWDGVTQGYHGEASLVRWKVCRHNATEIELETWLFTAPLHVRRTVSLRDKTLRVVDEVTNLSPRTIEVRLCQHPAFGEEFLDSSSYIETTARRFVADSLKPGSLSHIDATGSPDEVLAPGPKPGTISLPGPHSGESLSGALTDFPEASDNSSVTTVTFVSPQKKLSASLRFNTTIYPHAWVWVEANATPHWPWFQRLYAVAIEPANVLPGSGEGPAGVMRGGPGTAVEGGATLTSEVTLEVSSLD